MDPLWNFVIFWYILWYSLLYIKYPKISRYSVFDFFLITLTRFLILFRNFDTNQKKNKSEQTSFFKPNDATLIRRLIDFNSCTLKTSTLNYRQNRATKCISIIHIKMMLWHTKTLSGIFRCDTHRMPRQESYGAQMRNRAWLLYILWTYLWRNG